MAVSGSAGVTIAPSALKPSLRLLWAVCSGTRPHLKNRSPYTWGDVARAAAVALQGLVFLAPLHPLMNASNSARHGGLFGF
jgi:hypothetical protein